MTDKDNELKENIKFLAKYCKDECNDIRIDAVLLGALELINRQQEEIEKLKIENQLLRGAANSYKIHFNKAVNDFEKFAQQAYIDNPFACQYCKNSVADGRACLWKKEHKEDEEGCFGRYFEYNLNKMAGDTE